MKAPLTEDELLTQAYKLGAEGFPHIERERLLFEAWMKGHCWMVGTWLTDSGKTPYYELRETRVLFAAWLGRATLGAMEKNVVPDGYRLQPIEEYDRMRAALDTAANIVASTVNFMQQSAEMTAKALADKTPPELYVVVLEHVLVHPDGRKDLSHILAEDSPLFTTFQGANQFMRDRKLGLGWVAMKLSVAIAKAAEKESWPFTAEQLAADRKAHHDQG